MRLMLLINNYNCTPSISVQIQIMNRWYRYNKPYPNYVHLIIRVDNCGISKQFQSFIFVTSIYGGKKCQLYFAWQWYIITRDLYFQDYSIISYNNCFLLCIDYQVLTFLPMECASSALCMFDLSICVYNWTLLLLRKCGMLCSIGLGVMHKRYFCSFRKGKHCDWIA